MCVSLRCCYLLVSRSEKHRGRTYIGFTVNPSRRIRQHNGEIGAGARHTRRMRPWKMVLVLHGFPSKKQALQFEWAWQHPNASLVVRDVAAKLGKRGIAGLVGKVRLLHEMLHLPPWKQLPLTLQMLDTESDRLRSGCRAIPPHMETCVAPLEELMVDPTAEDDQSSEEGSEADLCSDLEVSASGCRLAHAESCCDAESTINSLDVWRTCAYCNHRVERKDRLVCTCSARFHVLCVARAFLSEMPPSTLVPSGGTCPLCHQYCTWASLVARATRAAGGALLPSPVQSNSKAPQKARIVHSVPREREEKTFSPPCSPGGSFKCSEYFSSGKAASECIIID